MNPVMNAQIFKAMISKFQESSIKSYMYEFCYHELEIGRSDVV